MPRKEPGYITRLHLQDSKNVTIADWRPDYIEFGWNAHTPATRIEIMPTEEIIGIFGSKQDEQDALSELGFIIRSKSVKK